ncbi:MAG: discoidin domain-containing protein [Roseiflexaceae bacterium]
MVDGDAGTKWLVFTSTGWVQLKLSEPVAIVRYALTSANDAPERDPRDWMLQGSQDGQNWTTLDTQTNQLFADRFQTKEYGFANTTAYLYYRLNITRNNGGPLLQLAELQLSPLSGGNTTLGDPKSWVLYGSHDGQTWIVIDERTDETFQWRLQTRPFKIDLPDRYTYYRLEVTANTAGASTSLAEMELLASPKR